MKKAAIGILLLLLLTGCWDRMPLKTLRLINMAGFDVDEKSGDVVLQYIITELKHAGQGGGEQKSEITELKGHSLVEAVGQGNFSDQGPFIAINTGVYFLSKRFATHDPVQELAFLLKAPYTSINTPVVVLDEGNMSQLFKNNLSTNKDFSKVVYQFVSSLEKNGIAEDVTMMQLILSRNDPFGDIALPLLKQTKPGMILCGALLFRQGKNTGKELDKDQVRLLMLLKGRNVGRQPFTGNFPEKNNDKGMEYGFSVKKSDSKISIHPQLGKLPKIKISVELQINVFELGKTIQNLNTNYVNRMEKKLGDHMEVRAMETIETLQKANCDVLGVGKQLKTFYPDIWKSLNWSKDYPRLLIEPNIHVQILNPEVD
ncbi:spore germination protein KC [Bacillus sp. SORGH_AS 510]|uniref:Ger(x)C family spore germination protein n=1 Tax=Bacillus sp. SORGH_AS_0510 TaxID=3041771 RepID=UPI002781934C|nr:Ger(x)C family spore germination protein [Bacillus sp. SORGH_AS_0510]MDQ1143889.1 spore germination protein KC [Bacillus sp. SORGH_AS_0510]